MRRWQKHARVLIALAIIVANGAVAGLVSASAGNPGGGGGGGTPKSISAAWVYSKDNADQVKSDISNGNYSDGQFLSNYTNIFLKNSALPVALQPAVNMGYDTNLSNRDNFLDYTFGYDCTSTGIASQDLTPTSAHWTVHYTIALDPGTNFQNDDQLKGHAYISQIIASPSGQSQSVGLNPASPIGEGTLGAPSKCFPFTTGTILVNNFAKLSSSEQGTYPKQASTVFNSPKLAAAGSSTTDDACEADPSTASFGWALCPAIDLADTTIQTLVNQIIIPELQITPLTIGSGDEYNVWQSIRSLADVLFVLIFLVIIFANALQFNLDAYTIKKMLPKLVAAAILVQFSFIISAIIVDLGNILGAGIGALVHVAVSNPHVGTTTPPSGSHADPLLFGLGAAFDTALLIGAVAIIGVPTIALAVLGGLISVIGVVFTLVARQLIIIMLVVLSPLAFAAFVLPNTDRYFSTWLKMFIRVTLMFPLIILLLNVAAIGQNASQGSSLAALLAVIFPIIAFFMIPITFKWAGSAMSFAANGINKATSGVTKSDAAKNLRKGARERQQRINQDRASGLAAATVFGRTIPGSRRVMTGLGRIGTGQVLPGSRTQSSIAMATQKAIADESKRIESLNLNRGVLRALATGNTGGLSSEDLKTYNQHRGIAKTLTGQAAVANQMAKRSDVEGLEMFRQKIVSDRSLGDSQRTQLWNGAKAGAFSEIKRMDPVMAVAGWADSDYTGAGLQGFIGAQKGEDIAGMNKARLAHYAANGATLTAEQLASATSDKMREGKDAAHQNALLAMTQNGAAATDLDIQREHLIRYDYSSGSAVARTDAQVREIKRKMALEPSGAGSYTERLNQAVQAIVTGTPPPGGGPMPTSIPLK